MSVLFPWKGFVVLLSHGKELCLLDLLNHKDWICVFFLRWFSNFMKYYTTKTQVIIVLFSQGDLT